MRRFSIDIAKNCVRLDEDDGVRRGGSSEVGGGKSLDSAGNSSGQSSSEDTMIR